MLGLIVCVLATVVVAGQQVTLPAKSDSVRFAVIGDSGTGGTAQYEVARSMAAYRQKFPFDFVIMVGDNIYGGERPDDFRKKFERPYQPLLDAGVTFHAALGNHDDPAQRFYKPFNMNGERYYTFTKKDVRFFVLDSAYFDARQLDWIERQLQNSDSPWKIAYFHHPLYSSGARHGPRTELREVLEPLFVRYGVHVVFAGHEHFYERIKPQKGINHFTVGGSAKLRAGNIRKGLLTATGFDRDNSYLLVEIAGDELFFQAISRTGSTVDAGVINRTRAAGEVTPPPRGTAAAPPPIG